MPFVNLLKSAAGLAWLIKIKTDRKEVKLKLNIS